MGKWFALPRPGSAPRGEARKRRKQPGTAWWQLQEDHDLLRSWAPATHTSRILSMDLRRAGDCSNWPEANGAAGAGRRPPNPGSLAPSPASDRRRFAGGILGGQNQQVSFHDPMSRPIGAERSTDQGRLALDDVGQRVILQIDGGAPLRRDRAVPDVDPGGAQNVRRLL